jgi:hypothetical protein
VSTSSIDSETDLLVLHAVRLKGMADDAEVAARFTLDSGTASELLLDFEAYGWVSRVDFAGTGGWTLTAVGKQRNERQLAEELAKSGSGAEVAAVHKDFLPLNDQLQRASTDWQLRPTAADPLAANGHDDPDWDGRVLDDLSRLDRDLGPLVERLSSRLARFAGYDDRFGAALARVRAGDASWVTRVRDDSCHTVWMELHEDLLATLGLERTTG